MLKYYSDGSFCCWSLLLVYHNLEPTQAFGSGGFWMMGREKILWDAPVGIWDTKRGFRCTYSTVQ